MWIETYVQGVMLKLEVPSVMVGVEENWSEIWELGVTELKTFSVILL